MNTGGGNPAARGTSTASSTPEQVPAPETPRHSAIGSVFPAHAVNLLAPQIPKFSGTESENVQLWVERVDRVARIHRATDEVILLAATSRLNKIARKWFDQGTRPMLESWTEFRGAILKRFDERRVVYHVALQKIEARKWNQSKETFHEYASDRLALMHPLNLSVNYSINMLISGISSEALRIRTAAAAAAVRVD